MKTTIRRDACSPALATWVEEQSRSRRAPASGDVLFRAPIGLPRWVSGAAVLGSALGLMGWDARLLWRFAHTLDLRQQATHALLWTAAVVGLVTSVRWLSTFGSPWRPTLVVVPGALVRISETQVEQVLLEEVTSLRVRLARAGVTVTLEDAHENQELVHAGFALLGGLTWVEGSALSKEIERAIPLRSRLPFAALPTPRAPVLRALGATAALFVVAFGLIALLSAQRRELVRAMMMTAATEAPQPTATPASVTPAAAKPSAGSAPALAPRPRATAPKVAAPAPVAKQRSSLDVSLEGRGTLPPELVERIVRVQKAQLAECLDGPSGAPISLRFEIDARGATLGSVAAPASAATAACLEKRAKALTFPQSSGSTRVRLVLARST
jgi:hypothetical protein